MLSDLVTASDTQIYSSLANKGGDVCSWEEDQGERKVLDERDV